MTAVTASARSPTSPGRYFWSLRTGLGIIAPSGFTRYRAISAWPPRGGTYAAQPLPIVTIGLRIETSWEALLRIAASGGDRGAGEIAKDRDNTALADPPPLVRAPGQHVVEVGHDVHADVVDGGRRVGRVVDPGGPGAHPDRAGRAVFGGGGNGPLVTLDGAYPQATVSVPGGANHGPF